MEELASYDPKQLIVGVLGGGKGTTRDTFELALQAERYGARVALFGRNLGDKLYAQTKVRQDPLVGNLNVWGAPRTYGIEIGARL